MEVQFRTKKLQKCFEKYKEASRTWGDKVARRYVERIQILQNIKSVADLETLPQLKFMKHHELKSARAGEHAIALTGMWRLHFAVNDDVVTVLEVTKHYGD